MNILHLNVQSLSNKLGLLELFIDSENIDIVCLSETWCTDLNIDTMTLNDFHIASYLNRKNHIHGEVMICVKNDIFDYREVNTSNFALEMTMECCSISFIINKSSYCLINIYRPPQSDITSFVYRLSTMLNDLSTRYDFIILCGDLNIDNNNL